MTSTLRRALWFSLAASAALGGCKAVPELPGVTPYRIDIQQGNYISQDMVDQLKIGMSREQVRFVLGTPLVTDIFHGDRWDYVYFRDPAKGKREKHRLVVRFENDKLKSFEGDVAPALVKPAPEPVSKPVPAPAAMAKPAAQAAASAAPPPATPRGGNWRAASDAAAAAATPPASGESGEKPDPVAAGTAAEAVADKPAASERGFFGRMLDKLGF